MRPVVFPRSKATIGNFIRRLQARNRTLLRSFQISSGVIYGEKYAGESGGWVPASLIETSSVALGTIPGDPDQKFDPGLMSALLEIPIDEQRLQFVGFSPAVLYSPIPYLPQALAIGVGRMLGASPITLMYLARIAALLASISLIYFAIRMTPIFKLGFMLLALMPMTLSYRD